ncbi:hypothetical protein E3C22_18360 [Jiella endophytica]|uniref:Transporter n=1 Tax=Jiella endophytica TaxID=2558362 RepID=A0A4Y8REL7_9HYPH|nr:hypothetical protein [Jiella endophytica]TFF19663.1 hypothetical protein E3C22_18360 [Jiella endophytica]
MPSFADVVRYFSGALLLMTGKTEGLKRLDLSADGFWQSFAAIVIALPPLALSWLAYEAGGGHAPAGDANGVIVYGAHAFADALAWLLPVLILMIVARPIGYSKKIVPLVVATNWGGALLAWAVIPYWLIIILFGTGEGTAFIGLLVTIVTVTATMRLIYFTLGKDFAAAVAITVMMIVASLMSYGAVMDVTGVPLV